MIKARGGVKKKKKKNKKKKKKKKKKKTRCMRLEVHRDILSSGADCLAT
jgi:hypothetical protein